MVAQGNGLQRQFVLGAEIRLEPLSDGDKKPTPKNLMNDRGHKQKHGKWHASTMRRAADFC